MRPSAGRPLWGNVLGCVLLGGMALLVTADVVMRGFGASLSGVFEVVEVLMGALVGCGLAYTGVTHSHLEVEILTDMMPRRVRHALGAWRPAGMRLLRRRGLEDVGLCR